MTRLFRKHKAAPLALTPPPARPPGKTFPPGLQQAWAALEEQIAHALYVARTTPDQLTGAHTAAVLERQNDLYGLLGEHLALICWYQQPAPVQADPTAGAAWQAAYLDRMGLTPYLKGTQYDPDPPARAD